MALNQAFLDSESDRNPTDVDPTDIDSQCPQALGPAREWESRRPWAQYQGWLATNRGHLATVISVVSVLLLVGGCSFIAGGGEVRETGYEEQQRFLEKGWASLEKANNETKANLVRKRSELIEAFRQYGALPQAKKDADLRSAAHDGNLQKVQSLIEVGANINAQGSAGGNALHLAAIGQGNLAVVEFLVKKAGADVNAKNPICDTPLMLAAIFDNLKIVKYLVEEAKADVSSTDCWDGLTARGLALERGHNDIADFLKRHGG